MPVKYVADQGTPRELLLGNVEDKPDEDIWPIVVQVGSSNEAHDVLSFAPIIKTIKVTSDRAEQLSRAWCSSGSQTILRGQDLELWSIVYGKRSAVFTS